MKEFVKNALVFILLCLLFAFLALADKVLATIADVVESINK